MSHVGQLGGMKSGQVLGSEFWDFQEWTSGFRWDLANVLKRCPYVVLVSRISEFRQAEIISGQKFGLDLESNIRQGWAEVVSGWRVGLDLESKAEGVRDRGQGSIFGIWVADLRR